MRVLKSIKLSSTPNQEYTRVQIKKKYVSKPTSELLKQPSSIELWPNLSKSERNSRGAGSTSIEDSEEIDTSSMEQNQSFYQRDEINYRAPMATSGTTSKGENHHKRSSFICNLRKSIKIKSKEIKEKKTHTSTIRISAHANSFTNRVSHLATKNIKRSTRNLNRFSITRKFYINETSNSTSTSVNAIDIVYILLGIFFIIIIQGSSK